MATPVKYTEYNIFFVYLIKKMTGIYKITSPSGKIYIGKSINIQKRFKQYKKSLGKGQPLLNRSFLKYGIDNHVFEIVCICDYEDLNDLERYYQLLFSSIGKNGLNIVLNMDKIFESKKEIEKRKKITDIIDSIII